MKNVYIFLCGLIAFQCLLKAHPIDFHYRGPEDDQLEREIEQKNAQKEYNEVYKNPESSQEEKDAATDRLDKAGLLA